MVAAHEHPGDPSPSAIVGLLADGDRLRVVAALALGAATLDDVAASSGLDARQAGSALARLTTGGLVERDAHGFRLRQEVLREAARSAARDPVPDDYGDAPPEQARVLRAFVHDGRLLSIPAARGKRRVVLELLAQDFEPGVRYSERQVNLMLGKWHADHAALRRYLVDDELLDRDQGYYWRVGGSYLPADDDDDADADAESGSGAD